MNGWVTRSPTQYSGHRLGSESHQPKPKPKPYPYPYPYGVTEIFPHTLTQTTETKQNKQCQNKTLVRVTSESNVATIKKMKNITTTVQTSPSDKSNSPQSNLHMCTQVPTHSLATSARFLTRLSSCTTSLESGRSSFSAATHRNASSATAATASATASSAARTGSTT